jgi:Na+-driven multidrug efflux pump
MVPFFCLLSVPFVLSRSVFTGFQRGAPMIVMSAIRYIILALPLCLVGVFLAPYMGFDRFGGLLGGLLVAAILSSVIYLIWTELFLAHRLEERRAPT